MYGTWNFLLTVFIYLGKKIEDKYVRIKWRLEIWRQKKYIIIKKWFHLP